MSEVMKVFVPASDEMLQNMQVNPGSLIPFNPEFLKIRSSSVRSDIKPVNWISNSDYKSARRRLLQSRVV